MYIVNYASYDLDCVDSLVPGNLTSPFSTIHKGWWSYHLSVHSIPSPISCTSPRVPAGPPCHGASYSHSGQALVSNVPYCVRHIGTSTQFMCGVQEIVSMLFLIKFVPNACSCAASIRPSVSFFKSPFLSHGLQPKYWYHQSNFLHSVLINTTSWLFWYTPMLFCLSSWC